MTEHSYDLVVLGGGSGGYAAAIRASELGAKVVVIERDKLGGTCLHRGCIPTKALLHAAEVADAVRSASEIGVDAILTGIDAGALRSFREKVVAKKFAGLKGLISARGITVVDGEGHLEPGRTVRVGSEVYRGENVLVATGSVSTLIPALEPGGRILTSELALELDEIPQRVIVLGGGVIGVEFASLWRSFGVDVTIIEALPRLVPNEDEAMSKGLERAFRKRGIGMHLGARLASATQRDTSVAVRLEDGTELVADYLLVAVGRRPRTATVGLAESGVTLDGDFVVVDEDLRTTADGVWAVGDIVRGLQLAHRSFAQGVFVAERMAGLPARAVPERQIPRVTYSDPEIASVGSTLAEAVTELGEDGVTSFDYNLAGNARSEIIGTGGLVRIVRAVDGPVIGVHLIGARVGELIAEAQLVVGWEAHPDDIAPYVHAHPTQSEALGEAFLALAGRPLHAL